jgi:hypothetical protein
MDEMKFRNYRKFLEVLEGILNAQKLLGCPLVFQQ